MVYEFDAFFDEEAKVWVARSEAGGMTTEGATKQELIERLRVIVPDVLQERMARGETAPNDARGAVVRIAWIAVVDRTELAVA